MLEPIVMDTIERYFDLLQAHVWFFLRGHQPGAAEKGSTEQVWHTCRLRCEPSEGRRRAAAKSSRDLLS